MYSRFILRALFFLFSFHSYLEAEETELLSLYSAVHQALKKNPELQGDLESVRISRAQIRKEVADFGWGLEALSRYEDRSKPQNVREFIAVGGVQLPGNDARIFVDENLSAKVGVSRKFSTGMQMELGTRFSRLSNSLNRTSANALYTPEYETFSGITLTQPLLKGFGKDTNLAGINIAKSRGAAQEILTRVKAMNLVAEVASRYTDIVTAEKVLSVHHENIVLAEKMLKRNKELLQSKEGLATDVTTAELALYQRQDQFISSTADKIERINTLFALIDRDPDLEGGTRFKPISSHFTSANLASKKAVIDLGRENRLDLLYYQHVLKAAELNVIRAQDASKAQLNLTGSAGLYGLDESAGGAFSEASKAQGTEWSMGLSLKMSLESDGADAALDAAEAQVRQARLELAKARLAIALEVDTSYVRVEAARQRILTAQKAVELAEERLKQEQELFEAGDGDFYRVVEQQQVLGDAKVNRVATEAALSKSVIALWLASGQIFERLGVSSDEVEVMISRVQDQKGDKVED